MVFHCDPNDGETADSDEETAKDAMVDEGCPNFD